MRKLGFVIEMIILIGVLGVFILKNADWIDLGPMNVFQNETMTAGEQAETEESGNTEAETPAEMQVPVETEEPAPAEVPVDPNSPEGRAEALGLPVPPAIDTKSWEYILVNSENKIDSTFAPEVGYARSQTSESPQDKRIVEALNKFAADAEAEGLSVFLSSGYRSYETQQVLFDLKCEEYDYETAATIVAIPGTSEHQTGLCCDITDIFRDPKNKELENTDTYKWLYAHCAEYGFILRFPENKEDITKIIYEPWHFRYVGTDAAAYIMENDLCLEEFLALYAG